MDIQPREEQSLLVRVEKLERENARLMAATWKRLFVIILSAGAGIALVLAILAGGLLWFKSRPKAWNSNAVTAKFASLELSNKPVDNVFFFFNYDLQNNTDVDYRFSGRAADEPKGWTPVEVVPTASAVSVSVLKKLKSSGSLAQDNDINWDSVFLPARKKARFQIRVSYPYDDSFRSTERNDLRKFNAFVKARLEKVDGFVLFDDANRNQIELPNGWQTPAK
jgi:hypothetical protein